MKLTIKSDFNFSVRNFQINSNGQIVVELTAPDSNPDSRYQYEMELGDGQASAHPTVSLLDYVRQYIAKSPVKTKTKSSYDLMAGYLERYGDRYLEDVTTEYLQGFIAYLEDCGLMRGTVRLYFQKLTCILHDAYRNELFDDRILQRVKRPKRDQARKEFLTEREVKRMMKTEVPEKDYNVRDMFLFSCFSGLRYGDVTNLKWKNVKQQGKHLMLEYHQQKTDTEESVPLCPQAESLLRSLERKGKYVFGRENEPRVNKALKRWCRDAHVRKNVSFHTARHTFCVTLLTHDVPIFTVQQLMCHSDIGTTKVYADLLNRTKAKAVRRIPLLA